VSSKNQEPRYTPKQVHRLADELVQLRMTVAELAQRLNVQSAELMVLGKSEEELRDMTCEIHRGWNRLVKQCCNHVLQTFNEMAKRAEANADAQRQRLHKSLAN
jgi:hypothetical protein